MLGAKTGASPRGLGMRRPAQVPRQRTPPAHVLLLAIGMAACACVAAFRGAGVDAARALATVHSRRLPPPTPLPPRPSTGCTPAQRDAQAAAFVAATTPADASSSKPTYRASACPSASILAALQTADPTAAGALTLVNVGANKGYGIAEVAALWRPDLGVNPASVYDDLTAAYPDAVQAKLRGACGDGTETVPQPAAATSLPALTVHAVEPLPVNVPLLKRLAQKVAARPAASPPARVFIHPGAVGPDPDAQLGFDLEKCTAVGLESCQMAPLGPGLTPVTGWTLDSFFDEHGLAAVDRGPRSILLKIDAEGYDGAIIMNATTGPGSAIDAVRAIEFEYHRVGKWGPKPGQVRLEEVVNKLDDAGLDCYLQFHDTLIHLTSTCWTGAYEFFQWSNVLCVRRDDGAWAAAAARLAGWKG